MKWKIVTTTAMAFAAVVTLTRSGEPAATNATPKAAESPKAVSAPRAEKKEAFPVIGYLEKRNHTITIRSGPKGPVYSVATRDGKVLFENLSIEQLKAQAPELHNLIKTGVAGSRMPGAKTGAPVKLDASI